MDSKAGAANPPSASVNDPTVTIQNISVQEALVLAAKNLTDEDFVQASLIIDRLLQTDPDLEPAKKLRDRIRLTASNVSREIFNQGVGCYMECDWDRAIAFWRKSLEAFPNDSSVLEWIHKAEGKKEQEKLIRAGLLQELEACGKKLSERNYVVAEEQLEDLKSKFTGAFRLTDLQKIYEALVVRTRIELEKEFEDLRSNIVEPQLHGRPAENQIPTAEPKALNASLQQSYMDAFETGKKYFENGQWQKALAMWRTAQRLNPHDLNLTHWIALAENSMTQPTIHPKTSPVRGTIIFFSVFVITAIFAYFGYEKYADYEEQSQNRILIQRSIEHYRAGRLEESWKMLQIYVLQDPENESARTLLERITAEMNARQKVQAQTRDMDSREDNSFVRIAVQLEVAKYLYDRNEKEAARLVLNRILSADPNQPQAKQLLLRIRNDSSVSKATE